MTFIWCCECGHETKFRIIALMQEQSTTADLVATGLVAFEVPTQKYGYPLKNLLQNFMD